MAETKDTGYAVMRWLNDGNRLSVHSLRQIVEPKLKEDQYKVGLCGTSLYQGCPGLWEYRILKLGGKKELKQWLDENIILLSTDVTDTFCTETVVSTSNQTETNHDGQSCFPSGISREGDNDMSEALQGKKRNRNQQLNSQVQSSKKKKPSIPGDRIKSAKEACKAIIEFQRSDACHSSESATFEAGLGQPHSASENLASSQSFLQMLQTDDDRTLQDSTWRELETDTIRQQCDLAWRELEEARSKIVSLQQEVRIKNERILALEEQIKSPSKLPATPRKIAFLRSIADNLDENCNQGHYSSSSSSSAVPEAYTYSLPSTSRAMPAQYSPLDIDRAPATCIAESTKHRDVQPVSRQGVEFSSYAVPEAHTYSLPSTSRAMPAQYSPLDIDQAPATCIAESTKHRDVQPVSLSVDREWNSPVTRQGERKVELVEGCGVYITKSQKASLAITGFKDARKVTIRLLDTLFDQRELAVMSAVGARQAHNRKAGVQTQAMPRQIKTAIEDFITQNCSEEQARTCVKDMNSIINSKCGTARRYMHQ